MIAWRIQSLRFIIVGVASNLILYLLYLILTSVGLGHKIAMTVLYLIGTLQTYWFNRRWTFEDRSGFKRTFLRYITAYALAYGFNLLVLVLLVDRLGLAHEFVQGVMIPLVAVLLFLLQKSWVFRPSTRFGQRLLRVFRDSDATEYPQRGRK